MELFSAAAANYAKVFYIRITIVMSMHSAAPATVGSAAASSTQRHFPVSFLIVSSVVEQGQ